MISAGPFYPILMAIFKPPVFIDVHAAASIRARTTTVSDIIAGLHCGTNRVKTICRERWLVTPRSSYVSRIQIRNTSPPRALQIRLRCWRADATRCMVFGVHGAEPKPPSTMLLRTTHAPAKHDHLKAQEAGVLPCSTVSQFLFCFERSENVRFDFQRVNVRSRFGTLR